MAIFIGGIFLTTKKFDYTGGSDLDQRCWMTFVYPFGVKKRLKGYADEKNQKSYIKNNILVFNTINMETHKISYKQSFADLNNLINSVVGDSEIIAISNVEVRFKSRVLKKVFFGVLIIIGIGIFNAVIDKILEFIIEDFFSSIKDIRVVLFITLFCGLVLLIGFLAGIAKVRDIIILTEDKIFVIQGIIKYGDNRFRAKEVTSIAIGEITKCTTNPLTLFRRFFKLSTNESKIYISQSYFWSTKTSLNSKFVNLRKFLQSVKTVDKVAYNYYFVEPQYILFFKGVLKFIFILYSLGIILIPFYVTWVLAKIRYDIAISLEQEKKGYNPYYDENAKSYNNSQRKYEFDEPYEKNKGDDEPLDQYSERDEERNSWTDESNKSDTYSSNGTNTKRFSVCNQSSEYVIDVAVCYLYNKTWEIRGWFNVNKNDCVEILKEHNSDRVYVYAFTPSGEELGGDIELCIHPTEGFSIPYSDQNCPEGYIKKGFVEIEVGDSDFELPIVDE